MTAIALVVYGDPVPQGSKVSGVTRTGKRYVREDNANALRKWRKAIVAAAAKLGQPDALDGPLGVQLYFTMARPASAARKRWPAVKPDLDKMTRAVLDALKTAQLIVDDSRVCELHATKLYPNVLAGTLDRPGVRILIVPLTPAQEGLPL